MEDESAAMKSSCRNRHGSIWFWVISMLIEIIINNLNCRNVCIFATVFIPKNSSSLVFIYFSVWLIWLIYNIKNHFSFLPIRVSIITPMFSLLSFFNDFIGMILPPCLCSFFFVELATFLILIYGPLTGVPHDLSLPIPPCCIDYLYLDSLTTSLSLLYSGLVSLMMWLTILFPIRLVSL